MGVDMITCIDCKNEVATINTLDGRCFSCVKQLVALLRAANASYAASEKVTKYNKTTLIEASYKINNEMFKRIPRTMPADYIKGYRRASNIAHDVLMRMIEDAK